MEVRFKDGYTVKCTPEHPFLTDSGWKSAQSLLPGTAIRSTLTLLHNTLMVGCTERGLAKDIYREAVKRFIEPYGKLLLDRFQRTVTSIIRMATFSTTALQTSNVCLPKSTCRSQTSTASFPFTPEIERHNGIDPKKVGFGIADMPSVVRDGQNGRASRSNALSAIVRSWVLREKAAGIKSIAVEPAAFLLLESVIELNERSDVWCLNVPDGQCFSLENGAVVHNSDAFMVMAQSLRPLTKDAPIKYPSLGIA